MFELKPVWSRSALAAHLPSSLPAHVLSAVLPVLAYYFVSGPWRSYWVQFGYDARTDPKAKTYQMLDIRVPRNTHFLFFCFFCIHCCYVLNVCSCFRFKCSK